MAARTDINHFGPNSIMNRFRRINGYNLTTDGDLTTSLTIPFNTTVRLNRITFKPTDSNVGDSFDVRIQSNESLGSVSLAVRSGSSGQTITLTTNVNVRKGWELLANREDQSLSLGTIIDVNVTNEGLTPTINVTVERDPNLVIPPMFQTNGITDIRYSIPLMTDIFIVDSEPIIYEGNSERRLIDNKRSSNSVNELDDLIGRLRTLLRDDRSTNQSIDINDSAQFRGRQRRRPRPEPVTQSIRFRRELNSSALTELINDLVLIYDLISGDQELIVTYNTDSSNSRSLVLYVDLTNIISSMAIN